MMAFVFKKTIYLELVKGLLASSSHFDLDLLFENRLRRRSAGFARINLILLACYEFCAIDIIFEG